MSSFALNIYAMGIKDKLISAGAEKFLKSYVSDFGKLEDLSIDTEKKIINIKLKLLGEAETFILTISQYAIIKSGGRTYLQINQLNTSRVWLNKVFEKYLKGKRVEIPAKYNMIIDFIE